MIKPNKFDDGSRSAQIERFAADDETDARPHSGGRRAAPNGTGLPDKQKPGCLCLAARLMGASFTARTAQRCAGRHHLAWNGCATEPFLATTSAAVGDPVTARLIDSRTAL